jgi:transposase InsO family protein
MGSEAVHVAIDDHSPIAFSAKRTERHAFLHAALAYYARLRIRVQAVLTPAYRSYAFATACRALGLKHRFTRPYAPSTNRNTGIVDRVIQTALRE